MSVTDRSTPSMNMSDPSILTWLVEPPQLSNSWLLKSSSDSYSLAKTWLKTTSSRICELRNSDSDIPNPSIRVSIASSVGAITVNGPSISMLGSNSSCSLSFSFRFTFISPDSRMVWSGLFSIISNTVALGSPAGAKHLSITCITPLSVR